MTAKKYKLDLLITEKQLINDKYCLLKLSADSELPELFPGQFVNVLVSDSPTTFLRRPISINYFDRERNEMWLLIQMIGDGTRRLGQLEEGDRIDVLMPLGNSFSMPSDAEKNARLLLIGGSVGSAPMLFLGKTLREKGFQPEFLIGGRSATDILQQEIFAQLGTLHVTTEDGSLGETGFVTQHTAFLQNQYDRFYVCGPKPMMMTIARFATAHNVWCEVSLENTMACGIGACLCCVEKTIHGNQCVCTEGPVFNREKLTWQI